MMKIQSEFQLNFRENLGKCGRSYNEKYHNGCMLHTLGPTIATLNPGFSARAVLPDLCM